MITNQFDCLADSWRIALLSVNSGLVSVKCRLFSMLASPWSSFIFRCSMKLLFFQSLQQMGNSRARAVYEANLPDSFRRPQTDSSLESFIRAKYEHKKYIAREWVPPVIPKVINNCYSFTFNCKWKICFDRNYFFQQIAMIYCVIYKYCIKIYSNHEFCV